MGCIRKEAIERVHRKSFTYNSMNYFLSNMLRSDLIKDRDEKSKHSFRRTSEGRELVKLNE